MTTSAPIPIFRIFDEEKALKFYVDFLDFNLEWKHRLEEVMPLYCGLRKGDCIIHLSEHHGDTTPGSTIRVAVGDVRKYCETLLAKKYKYANPECESQPWGTVDMHIRDPFGNRITFYTEYK